ncbi:MAG: hypothetical protein NTX07_04070, partial [Solirubrobacterales bacterium]|nr:hypothetical protein [Solirubrobacterales bacterium]
MSSRNRELLALLPASLLLAGGFAAVFIQNSEKLSTLSLSYAAIYLGLCLAGHVVVRITVPNADPYMFPVVAVLCSIGLVVIYRIDVDLARAQAQWFVVALIFFAATLVFLRDYRKLERYRYTIAAVSLGLLLLPRVPGIGQQAKDLCQRRVVRFNQIITPSFALGTTRCIGLKCISTPTTKWWPRT